MHFHPTHFNAASSSKTLSNNSKDEDANTDVDLDDNNSATNRQPQSEDCVSKMPSLLRSSMRYMQ